jgi:hypothetical protein
MSLQPYTADVINVGGSQQLNLSMSIPPGGSATTPAGATTYVQADWYAAGSSPPDGTYPITLFAQAIQAALIGVVTFPQTLLATVSGLINSVTVTLPINCTGLLVVFTGGNSPVYVTAYGVTSAADYLTTPPFYDPTTGNLFSTWAVEVSEAIDTQITITASLAPGGTWYVLSDSAVRLVHPIDPALGENNQPLPRMSKLVAGSDGTYIRTIQTDSSGRIVLAPAAVPAIISSAQSNANVTTANPGTAAAFGPVNQALLLKTLTMSLNIVGYTTAGVIILNFTVWNGAAYQAVGSVSLALSGVSPLSLDANIALDFGPGGLSSPAAGAGNPQFKVSWSYQITVATVISGNEVCTATYT